MVLTISHWRDIVVKIKREHPSVETTSYKYKRLVLHEGEKHHLSLNCIHDLAHYLNIKLFSRPIGIPESWSMSLCKSYVAQKYVNPTDLEEWVVIVKPDSWGGHPYIIHRTSQGFADTRWFEEVIPYLQNIIKDPTLGIPFMIRFNEGVNKIFASQNDGKGMTPGQIQALNLFFDKYVPCLEMCTTCFQVSLPETGAGERWLRNEPDGKIYEVRLSAAKPKSKKKGQQVEYVSQAIYDIPNKNDVYAFWDPIIKKFDYTSNMVQEYTHIPWETYDYKKFDLRMPLCKCKENFTWKLKV
ncbi:MAG: hypothetical protein H0V82_01565 [Candidatus Protochlamydia sp.]|nr:hypothetical protein [Candidatus Protochlamydia sp.]